MAFWLMKSEPDGFAIADLLERPKRTAPWDGVRNFQARNLLRDGMSTGDQAFFYHSSCAEPGVYGTVRIAGEAYPDPAQFDPKSTYHDPKSTRAAPRWAAVDVELVAIWKRPVLLAELRTLPGCEGMVVLRRGNRLSITPVTATEWRAVCDASRRITR